MKIKRNQLINFLQQNFPTINNYLNNVQYIKRLIDFINSEEYESKLEKFSYAYKKNFDNFMAEYKHFANSKQEPKSQAYLDFMKEFDPLAKPFFNDENAIIDRQGYMKLFDETIEKYPQAKLDYQNFQKEMEIYWEHEINIKVHMLDDSNLPIMTNAEIEACKFFIGKPEMEIVSTPTKEKKKVKAKE